MDLTSLVELKKEYEKPTTNYNIVSCCVFRMSGPYKDSVKYYYNGLKTISSNFKKYIPNFYLRIYYDESVISTKHEDERINQEVSIYWRPLFDTLRCLNYVQLIKFRIPDLCDGLYHIGLVGTLVRFLPLFDHDIQVKCIGIIDIDINESGLRTFKCVYDNFAKSQSEFHFKTRDCYHTQARFYEADKILGLTPPKIMHRAIASLLISKVKFPVSIFEKFLFDLINLETKPRSPVAQFADIQNKLLLGVTEIRNIKQYPIPYGIDEFFVNSFLMPDMESKNIPMSYTITIHDMSTVFYANYLRQNKYKNPSLEIQKLIRNILGDLWDNSKNFADNYTYFDNIIYQSEEVKVNRREFNKIKQAERIVFETIQCEFEKLKQSGSFLGFTELELNAVLAMKWGYPKMFVEY